MKNSELTSAEVVSLYMEYVANKNKNPKSIFSFCKKNNISETDFYANFSSFEAIQQEVYHLFFKKTVDLLIENEAYTDYVAQDKLLSFYFTFFELLTANRSYVQNDLKNTSNKIESLLKLKILRQHFKGYIASLDLEKIDLKHEKAMEFQEKSMEEFFWGQMVFILIFWLNDTSKGFEKTDIFIEKSVNTTFDVMNTKPLKSILDLGKFLFKEKMNFNA